MIPGFDLETLLRAAPFGIFLADAQGRYHAVNPAACTLTGYTAEGLLAMRIIDLLAPGGTEEGLDHFRRLLEHGQAVGEMRYRTKSGTVRWWTVQAVRLGPDRFLGFCEDITQRRAAETEVAHLADMLTQTNSLARVGAWWLDLADQSLHWSEVTREIHEVPPDYRPDVASGIAFYKAGESRDRITAAVERGLRDGTPYDLELQIITARGREIWVRTIGRFRGPSVRSTMMYGAFQDIDAIKRAQLDLDQARAAAEAAAVAKSLFLAKASHELRTPIHAVLGLSDLLQEGETDPARRAIMQQLGRAGRNLRDLVNDALDHERAELGRIEFERIPIDLRSLLQEVSEQLSVLAQERQVAVSCTAAPDVPPWVVGDPTRLRQVLNNLIANALRFTKATGAVVVNAAVCPGGARLRLTVTDTGIGIPPNRQQAIFQPFTQADASVARTHGGTGLGLAICRHLIEGMGGAIGVDSEVGFGSRFWFEVPLEHADPPTAAPGSDRMGRPDPIGLRVLVAEDEEINRFTMTRMLESLGCLHHVVGNGQEAVVAATRQPFDVVLLDLHMPVLDGCAATRAIRRAGSTVPILLLSATTDTTALSRAHAAGVNGHLMKPLALSELRHALRHLPSSKGQLKGYAM